MMNSHGQANPIKELVSYGILIQTVIQGVIHVIVTFLHAARMPIPSVGLSVKTLFKNPIRRD